MSRSPRSERKKPGCSGSLTDAPLIQKLYTQPSPEGFFMSARGAPEGAHTSRASIDAAFRRNLPPESTQRGPYATPSIWPPHNPTLTLVSGGS